MTPRIFKHCQDVKCVTKLQISFAGNQLRYQKGLHSQKYSVKLKKYSLTSLGDFFRWMQHKTILTFPAEKEEEAGTRYHQWFHLLSHRYLTSFLWGLLKQQMKISETYRKGCKSLKINIILISRYHQNIVKLRFMRYVALLRE